MTETKRLAEELRRTREELEALRSEARAADVGRAAFEAAFALPPVMMVLFDREMRFLRVSAAWSALTGMSEAEVVGQRVYDLFPWTQPMAPLHQRCLAGEACSTEYVAQRPDGPAWLQLDMAPWRAADGEIGGIAIVIHDNTDVVRSREAVRRSEQRLTLALEMSETVVWELSYADRRLFLTGAVTALFDTPPSYAQFAQDPMLAVHADDYARVRAEWDAHVADGRPFRVEHRLARPGAELWVDTAAEVLRGPDGAPERVVGVLRNITGRKHDQIAAAHAREVAESANRAKGEFLANMSHEIRTPLNGVIGVVGALGRTALTDEQQGLVRLIESSAHTLERFLTDVLDLARIEAGRFDVKPEPFAPGALLRQVHALFEPRAREKGLAFELALGPGCEGRHVADPVRLRQIVSNLVSNAVKFTDTGSVRLAAEVNGGALRLTVTDTGIGFRQDIAEQLFERFQQADGSITRRYGGSGLGLSISRTLAEHMGGELTAASEPGRGAVFTLVLPLGAGDARDADAAAPRARPVASPSCKVRRLRILLADDHPTNRRVVELILAGADVELVSVADGAEALVQARIGGFDLILMDMQMPVMDGLTAMREIRAWETLTGAARTPILALTANATAEHARASAAAGADGHVAKPISAPVLLAAIAEATRPAAPRSDAEPLALSA